MTTPVAIAAPVQPEGPSAQQAKPSHGLTFHEVLSALNPLQYLPVVGTIYRAVTGDTIPEPIRRFGSLIVSGLMGGPVGIAINIATTAAEKITGIDLDRTGQALLHGESIGHAVAEQTGSERDTASAAPASGASALPAVASAVRPWTAVQLTAYGLAPRDHAAMRSAAQLGADALNGLELARLRAAHAAYAQAATLAH